MTCHVIYSMKTGGAKVAAFKDVKFAEDWIEEQESNEDYTSMQIVVDYTMVGFYKEKFDELYYSILRTSDVSKTLNSENLQKNMGVSI
jgi:hypothetical protein